MTKNAIQSWMYFLTLSPSLSLSQMYPFSELEPLDPWNWNICVRVDIFPFSFFVYLHLSDLLRGEAALCNSLSATLKSLWILKHVTFKTTFHTHSKINFPHFFCESCPTSNFQIERASGYSKLFLRWLCPKLFSITYCNWELS